MRAPFPILAIISSYSIIKESCGQHCDKNMYVIPEYTFDFECTDEECTDEIKISDEHLESVLLPYDDAYGKPTWNSNRTALFELNCRLRCL